MVPPPQRVCRCSVNSKKKIIYIYIYIYTHMYARQWPWPWRHGPWPMATATSMTREHCCWNPPAPVVPVLPLHDISASIVYIYIYIYICTVKYTQHHCSPNSVAWGSHYLLKIRGWYVGANLVLTCDLDPRVMRSKCENATKIELFLSQAHKTTVNVTLFCHKLKKPQ